MEIREGVEFLNFKSTEKNDFQHGYVGLVDGAVFSWNLKSGARIQLRLGPQ